ncbi:MAG: hypothetical protein ACRC7O_16300 [Fimbriiglobus sp.]
MFTWFLGHVGAVIRPPAAGVLRLRDGLLAVGWGGAVYGAVMGTFGGLAGERLAQVVYSGLKVPLLLAATTALTLPSFFVLNSLAGLRADFPTALRAVVGAQGAVAVILACLAPYTAVWYLTTAVYHEALVFNGVMFLAASGSAQWVLRRRYAALIARDSRHRRMLGAWVVGYCLVGVQMGWVLRPFVGDPGVPTAFFRPGAWTGNAYGVVAEAVWRAAGGK